MFAIVAVPALALALSAGTDPQVLAQYRASLERYVLLRDEAMDRHIRTAVARMFRELPRPLLVPAG